MNETAMKRAGQRTATSLQNDVTRVVENGIEQASDIFSTRHARLSDRLTASPWSVAPRRPIRWATVVPPGHQRPSRRGTRARGAEPTRQNIEFADGGRRW